MRSPRTALASAVFLLVLGVVGSLAGYAVNASIFGLLNGRDHLYRAPDSPVAQAVLWVALAIPPAAVAAASVAAVAPAAAGSGIPEMKSLLDGIIQRDLLSVRTLIGKFVGVVAGHAAGLSIGREGPFVHLSAGLAHLVMAISPFSALRTNPTLRLQMYAAAIAVGVTSTFGAPIGGVLFSVEVTSHHYDVTNLPRAYVAAVMGVFFVWGLGKIPALQVYPNLNLFDTHATPIPYSWIEFVGFAAIGIVSGFLGALYVMLAGFLVRLRKRRIFASHPYVLVIGAAVLTALIAYPLNQFFVHTEQVTINQLVAPETDTHAASSNKQHTLGSSLTNLAVFVPVKFVMTAVGIVLPIPAGTFTPVFTMGAALGRLVGELLAQLWPRLDLHPAGYAIVGAGALTCGVTRSISTAIITLELTGQTHHLVPVFLAVLLAYSVGNMFSVSIYEAMHVLKGLPFMPSTLDDDAYAIPAAQIMRSELKYLTLDTSFLDVVGVLLGNDYQELPLVDSHDNRIFIGTIGRSSLENELEARVTAYAQRRGAWMDVNPPVAPGASSTTSLLFGTVSNVEGAEQMTGLRAEINERIQHYVSSDDLLGTSISQHAYWKRMVPLLTPATLRYLEGVSYTISSVDEAPFSVVPQTQLRRIDFLFKTCGINHMWVVARGELCGVITKKDTMNFEMHRTGVGELL